MSKWTALVERSGGLYEQAHFESAALALVTRQALYRDDHADRVSYRIVQDHLGAFKEWISHCGMDIVDDRPNGCLVAIPLRERPYRMTTEMTLLVLSLAQLYDLQMKRGQMEGHDAIVTIEELKTTFRTLGAGRELPSEVTALKALLSQTKRMGMTELKEPDIGSEQPFDIAIRPAIVWLVSAGTAERLASYYQSKNANAAAANEEETDEAA